MFWESKKDKELKENKALEAILSGFQNDIKIHDETIRNKKMNNLPQQTKPATVETLARFLSEKGVFVYSDWEEYRNKFN